MAVQIEMEAEGLIKALKDVSKNMQKELNAVAKKTGRRGKTIIAKVIAAEVTTPQKDIKKAITVWFPSYAKAVVSLAKENRFSLKRYKARQTKTGLSYKINKKGNVQKLAGAFIVDSLGGHAFKRIDRKGKSSKIVKLHGPSPWGVLTKDQARIDQVTKDIRAELQKQLKERIRYRKLKTSGAI